MNIALRFSRLSAVLSLLIGMLVLPGCASHRPVTPAQIHKWERARNVKRLSEVARQKTQRPAVRKLSLESLARLNWKPTNEERLEVYRLIASPAALHEARGLLQTMSRGQLAQIDADVNACASLLTLSGGWVDAGRAHGLYDRLRSQGRKAVTMSLCQQVLARPALRTRILLLAIKLGLPGSERDLNAVLQVYGDKPMAEDYMNSGSKELENGGRHWASTHGYLVSTGNGSHRSSWGSF